MTPLLWNVTPPEARMAGGLQPAIDGMTAMAGHHGWRVQAVPAGRFEPHGEPPQLVHFHGLWEPGHWRCYRWCRRRRVPYLISPHGMLEPWALRHRGWKKSLYLRWIEQRHLLGSEAVVTTSQLEAANVRARLPQARTRVAALGLQPPVIGDRAALRQRLGIAPDQRLLLFLSRIDPKKGLPHVLRGLAKVAAARTQNWKLAVVGPLENAHAMQCQQLARELAAKLPAVDWLGGIWGEPRFDWLQAADLLVLPTHSENFGLVVLEALMVGTPVMTTRFTPWAALEGMDGVHLVEPDANSVAARLKRWGRDPGWGAGARKRLAEWARRSYAWDALIPAYAALYGHGDRKTIGSPHPTPAHDSAGSI